MWTDKRAQLTHRHQRKLAICTCREKEDWLSHMFSVYAKVCLNNLMFSRCISICLKAIHSSLSSSHGSSLENYKLFSTLCRSLRRCQHISSAIITHCWWLWSWLIMTNRSEIDGPALWFDISTIINDYYPNIRHDQPISAMIIHDYYHGKRSPWSPLLVGKPLCQPLHHHQHRALVAPGQEKVDPERVGGRLLPGAGYA